MSVRTNKIVGVDLCTGSVTRCAVGLRRLLRNMSPVGDPRSFSPLPSLMAWTSLSVTATGLPPPMALAAATQLPPLPTRLAVLFDKPVLSAASTMSPCFGSGTATATNAVLASTLSSLAVPTRTAALLLVSLSVILLAGSIGLAWVERAATRRLSHWFGWRSVLITGWIGTPIHELSHLAACKALGLRVVDHRLFQPDPRTATLGYVHYVQEGSGVAKALRRFIVGTAPLVTGLGILTVGWIWILGPQSTNGIHVKSLWTHSPSLIIENLAATAILPFTKLGPGSWKLWLWAYFALSVGLHMAPSRTDLKNAALGIPVAWLLALMALILIGLLSSPAKVTAAALPILSILGSVLVWTSALAVIYLGCVWIASRLAAR